MSEVTVTGIEEARKRIKAIIHHTPIITSEAIDKIAGCHIFFKSEHLQKTGSFKARGATNAVSILKEEGKVAGVVTHSSGNHGQGLAWAAAQFGLPCCVVVPRNAPTSKVEAMAGYGSRIERCGNSIQAREEGCARMAAELNYGVVEPFNYVNVIHGQGTLGAEILEDVPDCDAVFLAVGGGGLASGVAKYIGERRPDIKVFLVEPVGKSLGDYLASGKFGNNGDTLNTVADGIRVLQVGSHCFPVLQKYCSGKVITVTEQEIRDAVKLIWTRTKQRVEPTAGVPLAGLLKTNLAQFAIKKAVIILCGGNVDTDFIP